jgi:small membrane protein
MLGIRVLLIVALASVLLWFLRSRNATSVRAVKKLLLAGLVVFAIVAVVQPELTDTVASWLGVGRGADLLIYAVTVAFLFVTLNGYLKFHELQGRLTTLAREVALLEQRLAPEQDEGR